jgi:hypothetical protein
VLYLPQPAEDVTLRLFRTRHNERFNKSQDDSQNKEIPNNFTDRLSFV